MPLCQVPRSLRDRGNNSGSLRDAPPTAEGGPRGQSGRNPRSPLSEEVPGARLAPLLLARRTAGLVAEQPFRANLEWATNRPHRRGLAAAPYPSGRTRSALQGGWGGKEALSLTTGRGIPHLPRSLPAPRDPSPCPISATGPSPGPAGSPCLRRHFPEPPSQLPPPTPPPPPARHHQVQEVTISSFRRGGERRGQGGENRLGSHQRPGGK